MTPADRPTARRRPDGSIDTTFHAARGRDLRSQAARRLFRGIARSLARAIARRRSTAAKAAGGVSSWTPDLRVHGPLARRAWRPRP